MPIIIIRPKDKIPAFPAKMGEKPMVFQIFQPNSEKGSFSSFSSIANYSSQSGHPDFKCFRVMNFCISHTQTLVHTCNSKKLRAITSAEKGAQVPISSGH